MASAVRSVSCDLTEPIETATTSVASPALLDANRFLDGDLVEGVHRHLDVGEIDPAAVRLDADLDVEVDDTLHRNENLHAAILSRTCFWFPPETHRSTLSRKCEMARTVLPATAQVNGF